MLYDYIAHLYKSCYVKSNSHSYIFNKTLNSHNPYHKIRNKFYLNSYRKRKNNKMIFRHLEYTLRNIFQLSRSQKNN
jgi:hypothetical protein